IDGNYTVKVEQLATGARASKKLDGATNSSKLKELGMPTSNFTITIDSKEFKVNLDKGEESTVDDLVNAIKSATDGKEKLSNYVNVSFSEISKDLIIETKETGKAQKMSINGTSVFGTDFSVEGQDAKITVTTPQGGTGTV
ncbi:hypothetical protein G7A79_28655, partial [Coprococcus sp. MSK.21.13]|nr:hypothetical protein [Coprococcus sp. MSK.21.13]